MPPPSSPRRILIVRPSALGDVCRSVPVLATLRKTFSDAEIDWVVQSEFADAIAAHPDLDEVIAFPRTGLAEWWKSAAVARAGGAWLRGLRERRYDLVFDLQGLGRSGLMTFATGARRRVGFRDARELSWIGYNVRHSPPPSGAHTVDRMLALLKAEGIEPVRDMRLYVDEEDRAWWRQRMPERYAVLAPTARWLSKRWPIERWKELIAPLLMRGFEKVVIIGAPGERGQVELLLHAGQSLGEDSPLIDLVGACTIGQTMAVIEGAGLVVANDSAPLHMAVGLDVPCLGLFGPTDPAIVGPYRKPQSALRAFLPRPGEIVSYRDPKLEDRLMGVISTASVIQAIDRVLAIETSKLEHKAGQRAGLPQADHVTPRVEAPSASDLYLASASPRRRRLLEEMGLTSHVIAPDIDDGLLSPRATPPEQWVTGLAYLKARRVADQLQEKGTREGIVLGADTVCASGGELLGQPRDAEHARHIMLVMRGKTHRTITGVCLIDLADDRRLMFHDAAEVTIGEVSDAQIDQYIASGEWRGKAGAYNLSERIDAGWPVSCKGDPATVMGLPAKKLRDVLDRSPFQKLRFPATPGPSDEQQGALAAQPERAAT